MKEPDWKHKESKQLKYTDRDMFKPLCLITDKKYIFSQRITELYAYSQAIITIIMYFMHHRPAPSKSAQEDFSLWTSFF